MPDTSSSRLSYSAAALFLLVVAILIAPLGALVNHVIARTTGGNLPAQLIVAPDPLSDAVSATAAEFRVDESGAATYSIPLYAVPGTAGVAPQLSLSYSSQAGYGPVGKGWSIGGMSSITRCRATREAGDFIGAATPDGNPSPINFTASDRYCLDGQRLIPAATTCASAGGLTASAWSTEIDSFQRVCAYSGQSGPAFFTVERKDGSISWYGDRDNSTSANRPDGYFETTSPLNPAAALSWAQTRFQDSTGNYIDYLYLENPAGAGTGEHLLSEVRYTGKVILSGQAGSASAPYARVIFNYAARAVAQWSKGYASGGVLTQSRRLDSITSCATIACATADQARHYLLTYANNASGSQQDTLVGLQECRDSTGAVCASPTSFAWSQGKHEFITKEYPANLQIGIDNFKGFKLGDVNGDGRPDFVYLRTGGGSCTTTEQIVVAMGGMDGNGSPAFTNGQIVCTPASIRDRGEGSWHLFDYNGDGRDDLFVSAVVDAGWRVYLSNGAGFDSTQNVISSLSPAIPSYAGVNDQVQLSDINGDGLTDIVYPRDFAMRIRVMERQGNGFAWGAERDVNFDTSTITVNCPPDDCRRTISGTPSIKTGFTQLADFNGDSSSDLLLNVTERWNDRGCNHGRKADQTDNTSPEDVLQMLPYESESETERKLSSLAAPCYDYKYSLHTFTVQAISNTTITLGSYGYLAPRPDTIALADANGDGLTDLFYRNTSTSDWQYDLNTGRGFLPAVMLIQGGADFREHTRFLDVNGDSRADMLVVLAPGGYKTYGARYALAGGGFAATATTLPGGNAIICEGVACVEDQKVPFFSDLDGDGNLDFMSIKMDDNPDILVSRASSRFTPRDVIIQVTNGLGTQTNVTYAPLTNKDVYRRGTGARNATNWGRGSPVLDMLAPSYVVARASSSSPQAGAPNAMATVHYRYANARVQSGGRGYLGFETIDAIDPNQSGGYVVTSTRYAQNFPFVGMPVQTTKNAVAGATYAVPACLSGAITNACFTTPGQMHPGLGGSWFSSSVQSYEVAPANLATQVPLHVRTLGTEESLRDPFTGALTSKVATAFSYGTNGNVTQTVVDTYTGAETSPTATLITANTYSDDTAKWRLGRLTASTVTHRRPGRADVVRTTGFNYSMSGAATGLLTDELVQPGGAADQALTNTYLLDHYGNRVQSVTCAAPATSCGTAGFEFHPANATTVKRYSRVDYDANGRFPVLTYEPFWNGAGSEERVTSRVLERNVFGDVVNAVDTNNVRSFAIKGAMGRDYYAWAQTNPNATPGSGGAASLTTYRWCSQVACPVGAKFRQQVATQGAPRQWSYFDVLGRPIMKAAETFNVGVIDEDVSAVCTEYEATGKPRRSSNPFFLPGTAGEAGPVGIEGVCSAPARLWTVTTYDVLGRTTHVLAPDGSQVSSSYSGLATTSTDPRGNATVQVRNGKGELATVTDAAGSATSYSYSADGNLLAVGRNAGSGAISNQFVYDVLGRKIQQTDPDTGTTTFQYNALGDLVAQIDAAGQRIENEIDARGRVWRKNVKLANGTIESQSTFTFDTAQYGAGALAQETVIGNYSAWAGQTGTGLSFNRNLHYDTLGRPIRMSLEIDGQTFGGRTEYDTLGRPWKSLDASNLWTKTHFNTRGAVAVCASNEVDLDPSCANGADTYQRTLRTDAWGNVVKERRGDNTAMEVNRSYYAQTGRLATLCAGNSNCNLTNEVYGWDAAGNLSSHQKEQRYLEGFTYDSLNRLVEGKLLTLNGVSVNQVSLANGYDALGNICSKNGLGYDYVGADGCVGAAARSAPMTASAAPARASALPAYQRRTPVSWKVPAAWREARAHQAPENRSRRYSDDKPSWEHEADDWGIGDELTLKPNQRFWVRNPPRSRAAAQAPALQAIAPAASNTVMPLSSSSGSPHAVSQTGTGTSATFYYYDGRGNQTVRDAPGSANDRTITYSADDKAHEISMGSGQRVRFWYGPDGQRYKRDEAGKTTYYVGGVEVILQGGVTTFKRYLGGIALQTVVNGGIQATKYLFHDHLGSLVRIANADGSVAESLDYTAFGDRRSYGDPNASGAASSNTPRGFTGHEYIDGTGVIHMNGRIYDQQLGRFLQADPVIQAPDNVQSWNAYTYVFNNPLAYTDPSGNISLSIRQIFAVVFAAVYAYFTWDLTGAAAVYAAMIGGAITGAIATGTWKGAITGAFTGAVTAGIGWAANANDWGNMARIGAQAVSGGVMESLQGGSFGNGFLAAGVTAAVMPQVGKIQNDLGRTVAGALVGGTISEATGGKFANGAISGAIQGAMAGKPSDQDRANKNHYQDENPVGNFVTTDSDRQAFAEAMVRRGNLGDPALVKYVSNPNEIDPNAWMDTSPDGKLIRVFPQAFEDLNYYSFGTTLYHEYVHHYRNVGYTASGFKVRPYTQAAYMKEAEAYTLSDSNLNPFRNGITEGFRQGILQNNFNYGAGALTKQNLQRLRNLDFDCSKNGGC